MAITTKAALRAARKQFVSFYKGFVGTSGAHWYGSFNQVAVPAPGNLTFAVGASGAVQSNASAGYPVLESFGGLTGYIADLVGVGDAGSNTNIDIALIDRIYVAGTYNFDANTVLAAQPSIAARVPDGDYSQIELWYEQVAAATGGPTVTVTYTNQDGVAGRTTGAFDTAIALTAGAQMKLPLQAGDTGVQKIESVVATIASGGTFNLLLVRRLVTLRRFSRPDPRRVGLLKAGLPVVLDTSCLVLVAASALSGGAAVNVTIAMG